MTATPAGFLSIKGHYHLILFHILLKVNVTGQYEDKIKIMFAGKVAPDVIFMYPTALPAWVDLDALAPID